METHIWKRDQDKGDDGALIIAVLTVQPEGPISAPRVMSMSVHQSWYNTDGRMVQHENNVYNADHLITIYANNTLDHIRNILRDMEYVEVGEI